MPVRYDIAAQIPQYGGGDTMNMLAQMQSMGYRQQQNALAELQMRKLSQELQAQQAIRGLAPNLNMADPNVVRQIWAQDPEFARQIYGSQLAGQREQRMAEQAAASAANIRAEQALRERRYGEIDLPKSQLEAERERRSDYEYREVTDATGATRVVAIPKKSPQAGAVNVPGTAGMKPKDFGFMAGPPDTGLVTRTDPRTGQAELITPSQPILTPPEGKMGARIETGAPPQAAPEARGALIPSEIRPTAEAPVGSAAYNNKRFATEALDAVGFNADTGEDKISSLIKKSTSGGLETGAAGIRGFFGRATPGMEAVGQIKAIANDIILKKMNGKLGAGISNEDREFIKSTIGNLDDPSIPANQRLASWNSTKQILMKYANTGGQSAVGVPANRKPLNEIFQ